MTGCNVLTLNLSYPHGDSAPRLAASSSGTPTPAGPPVVDCKSFEIYNCFIIEILGCILEVLANKKVFSILINNISMRMDAQVRPTPFKVTALSIHAILGLRLLVKKYFKGYKHVEMEGSAEISNYELRREINIAQTIQSLDSMCLNQLPSCKKEEPYTF